MLAGDGRGVNKPSENRFYDQHIQPVFNSFCVNGTSPCHRVDPDTHVALGNLDLSSFEGVQKRRDVLRTYGAYPQPLLLLKALPEERVLIPFQQKLLPSEIRHAGGKPIAANSDAFYELKSWLDNGANRDGIAPPGAANTGRGECNRTVPAGAVTTADTTSQAFQDFSSQIMPTLRTSCAFGTCHSSPQSDFYLTCGDQPDQLAFNYNQAAGFVIGKTIDVQQSELLLRPLAPAAGGVDHTGRIGPCWCSSCPSPSIRSRRGASASTTSSCRN